jgi:hypothetical protein
MPALPAGGATVAVARDLVSVVPRDAYCAPGRARAGDSPSRRLLNTAARMATAAAARSVGDDAQVLGFTPCDFVVFGLPYRNPGTPVYVRRNGALTFTVTGGQFGVPYGQDRLLVIRLATVFKMCGSPESNAIAFDSLRDVARTLGKSSSGQQRQRIQAGLLRLFDATFLASDARPNAIRRERYQLIRRVLLWKDHDARQPNRHTDASNVIVFDPVFAADIRSGAVPTDLQAVLALSENMGALSLYQFEAHASYQHARYGKPDRTVPVLGPPGLLAQIGCGVSEGDTRKARATIRHWHGFVKRVWPDCPNQLSRDDTVLVVRAGHAIARGRLPSPKEFAVRPFDRIGSERPREPSVRLAIDRERILTVTAFLRS